MTGRASEEGGPAPTRQSRGLAGSGVVPHVTYSGVAVALLAFALTRLFVAATLEPDVASYVVAGAIPLLVGLGLTLYGVGLALGAVSPDYALTIWHWTVLGTASVLALLAITGLHSVLAGAGLEAITDAPVFVGNALLGGAVAGAIVGHRFARSREREVEFGKYAERATLVNRLLRHDVLNAATVVKGYADRLVDEPDDESTARTAADAAPGDDETAAVIRRAAVDVEDRVSRIKEFVSRDARLGAVPVDDALDEALERTLATTGARLADDASLDAGRDGTVSFRDRVASGDESDHASDGLVDDATDDDTPRPATDGAGVELRVERSLPDGTLVRADERLVLCCRELLENAVEHAGAGATVTLRAEAREHDVVLSVADDGPGLPERVVEPLATPGLPEQDDPRLGYGLQMVRLLVDHYDATLAFDGRADDAELDADVEDGESTAVESADDEATDVDLADDEATDVEPADGAADEAPGVEPGDGAADPGDDASANVVTLTLRRTTDDASIVGPGVPIPDLYRAGVAAVVAGLAMGVVLEGLTGAVPTIGQLYAVDSPTIGWLTHLFHSVLFGLLVAALLDAPAVEEWADDARRYVLVGTVVGAGLWLVAAGVVMPLWLRAVDAGATFPNLSAAGLLAHVVWGALLGWGYWTLPSPGDSPVLARLPLLGRFAGGA